MSKAIEFIEEVLITLSRLTSNSADRLQAADYNGKDEYESLLRINRIAGELIEEMAGIHAIAVDNETHH